MFKVGDKVRAKRKIGTFVKKDGVYEVSRTTGDLARRNDPKLSKLKSNLSLVGDTSVNPVNSDWPVGYYWEDFEVVE